MTLTALVGFFRNNGTWEEFCASQQLDPGAEGLGIYMPDQLKILHELAFFDAEETDGIEYHRNGQRYCYLLEFFQFREMMEEMLAAGWTDTAIAQRIFEYGINDA